MRIMKFLAAVIAAALFSTSVYAEGLTDMSDAERDAFRAEVRAYLLDNPEVIIEAVQILEQREAAAEAEGDLFLVRSNYDELVNDGYSFVGGNPEGAITIVEFSDYRCGYCKRAHPEIQALLEANDDIRLVLKEFPILGPDSTLAAQAAMSILFNQPDAYEDFSHNLMTHNGPVNEKTLSRIASSAGADAALMLAHMNDDVVTQAIAKTRALGQKMKISGTPTFIIGPEMVRGFVPLAGMQQIVDAARAQLQ